MKDPALEPRLSRLNKAYVAMTQENIPNERKKPGHVNIRQAAVHSSNFGSFSASPLNDHDDNSGSPWAAQYDRRQPSSKNIF